MEYLDINFDREEIKSIHTSLSFVNYAHINIFDPTHYKLDFSIPIQELYDLVG